MEARLIWGTNAEKSPDPKHKKLEGEMAKKLSELPFKWKNYYEVTHKEFTINDREYNKVVMSEKCFIEVKDKGDSKVTVKLYGDGNLSRRIDKPLPKDETIAIGGDDKDNSAWFITVRPINGTPKPEPKKDAKPPTNAAAKPAPAK